MQGIPTIIPQQILQLKQIFGVSTTLSNSICLLSPDRIFYIAGYHGVIYNPKQKEKSQSYFPGAEGCKNISSVCVHPNRKYMTLGFKSQDRPCLLCYELHPSARRRKIQLTENFPFNTWVSVAFSPSNQPRQLASLTNKNQKGESLLVFWNPQKGKSQGSIRIKGNQDKQFSQILFNPFSENTIVSVLGERTFKIFQYKIVIEQKTTFIDPILNNEAQDLLVSTYSLKSHLYLASSQHIAILANQGTVVIDHKLNITQKIDFVAHCSDNWAEGFILAGNSIRIYRYEDHKYNLKCNYEFNDKEVLVCSISVNDDKIAILLSTGSMMQGKIKFQSTKEVAKLQLDFIGLPNHSGGIVGMDICIRKPLIATASKDKTIKIWNYQERTVETPKSQAQAASCLSFHPSGLHLAVAYSDKLRVMNLQKDGQSMSNYKDINSFRNCTSVKFSNGGQYFAASSGNLVHIFKFYTGENPTGMTLQGHSGNCKIKSMAWSKEDNILVTCGTDGLILAHRVALQISQSNRNLLSKQTRTKGVVYSCVAINNQNTIYAMGMSGSLGERIFKQIKLDGTQNKRELGNNNCSQIVLPSTGRILFCGTDDRDHSSGSIKCYKYPSTQHLQQFQAHDNLGVERLCVSADDKYLISAGRDGCIMVFEIRDKQARSDKLKQLLPPSNQILITKNDLDLLKTQIDALKQQKNELQGVGVMGSIKDDQVKQLMQKYSTDESQFQQKYNAILEKKNLLRKKFDEEIRTKKQQYDNSLQQYDSTQAKNVMQESAKYDELKRSQEDQLVQFQKQINRITQENERQIKKLEEDYRQKIKNQKDQKNNVKKKIQRLAKQHEQTMKQIQQEKIQQIEKLKKQNSKAATEITEASLRAKSQVSITKKKISEKEQEKQKKIQEQNQNIEEIKMLEKANQQLQRQIQSQANTIQERDKTIDGNQRKIYQLKKKSQQLQKFKYVLDHKIKQLKKDIAPRESEIAQMKAQTNAMDKKLKQLNSTNTGLAEFVAELFENQTTLKKKIAAQRTRISFQINKIESFKDALYQTAQLIQNQQKLKESASELHAKFVSQSMTQVQMDSEIEQQYKNQRKYLQKSIALLKKNLQKDTDIHKHQNIRIMKDNVDLIREISSLRLQILEDNKKKGNEQEKRGKNEPKQEELRADIAQKTKTIEAWKKQIEYYKEKMNNS